MYDHTKIETRWQKFWADEDLFQNVAGGDVDPKKDKLYLLFAFAYPSGSGLHVGHVESNTALDIMARFYRMNGKQVIFPVGWDAFGLPAENYAIKTGIPPVKTTRDAINTFRKQIQRLAISYDWAGEIATSHPDYYRWTQWLFLKLYEKGLAYKAQGLVNWCPSCQTVLANEQVVDGKCERCETQVIQRSLEQWYFKITKYKDELIAGLDQVDWPEPTKQQQINWIGKKEGAEIEFKIQSSKKKIECFTTRVDTVFGVTFVVLSPEKFGELKLDQLQVEDKKVETAKYIELAFSKTEEERKIGEKDKTGIDTGLKAINPVNQTQVPIFVADYVLANYGTGAVMGVPAHDDRDFEFAQTHGLEIKQVILCDQLKSDQINQAVQEGKACYSGYGVLTNSLKYDGLTSEVAKKQLLKDYSDQITATTNYRLRDWLISRQRYWGVPIPIVYDPEGKPHAVKNEHLPWTLPEDVDFKPTGESPLKSSQEFFERTERLYGKGWKPEVDTMDTFVDSSWYYLRYADPRNQQQFASPEKLKQWLPVDFYMIGPEHIVLHLLYSRFFTKFLRDEGYLNFDEPFIKMRHQGMILGPNGKKMSKSKGNVITPDEVIEKFGADTLRLYEMFMGPIDADKPWDTRAVIGIYKFMRRIYDLTSKHLEKSNQASKTSPELEKKLHQTLAKVTNDIPLLKFNTAIASMMELVNVWEKQTSISKADLEIFVLMLAPFAPFLAEDIFWQMNHDESVKSVHLANWPKADLALAQNEQVTMPIQINGKVRAQLEWPSSQIGDKAKVLEMAKALPQLKRWLDGQTIQKEIYVSGKIVNFVILL